MFDYYSCPVFINIFFLITSFICIVIALFYYFIFVDSSVYGYSLQLMKGICYITPKQIGTLVYFNGKSDAITKSDKGKREIFKLVERPGYYLADCYGTTFGNETLLTLKPYDDFLKPGLLLK